MSGTNTTIGRAAWRRVSDIPAFPFASFAEVRGAVREKRFSLGVESQAAARWADENSTGGRRAIVAALSLLLVAAAVAAVVAALWLKNYWLLAALPVQAAAFYFSHPSSPARPWATAAGTASLIIFVSLVFNRWPTEATLVAYAGLTFAAVRLAAFVNDRAFRKAVLEDEALFLRAYAEGACALRDNESKRVHTNGA